MTTSLKTHPRVRLIPTAELTASSFSISIYGDPDREIEDLLESVREHGVLVPLVVVQGSDGSNWKVISGHRRLACARVLNLLDLPCEVRDIRGQAARQLAILEYNRQRRKNFSQLMREADAFETLYGSEGLRRRRENLRQFRDDTASPDRRNSDGRTDSRIAKILGLGGKDLYRQARAIWKSAEEKDARALSGVAQLDAGTKSIHAAYKDLRRRDRFTSGFRPTPYDVWPFKHDRAFGIPHPGSIPPAIVAHTLHYYTQPGDTVVDPMAGGGTTLDVCESMGRRCFAYDIAPVRPEIIKADVKQGFPLDVRDCDLIFCDPPYHTMLARRYAAEGASDVPFAAWIDFLNQFARDSFATLRPGGHIALLLANQTEKDLPAGFGYLDHAFYGYTALIAAGFLPERRVSCPMDGAYRPQDVRRARVEGRMLGQVRDLLIMRKPGETRLYDKGSPQANS